jgi:hypothetical protein
MLMLLALAVMIESSRVVCCCCCVYFNYMLDHAGWEEGEESWSRARSFYLSCCCLLCQVTTGIGMRLVDLLALCPTSYSLVSD